MAPPRVTAESTPRTRATSHPHPRPRPLPRSPNPNPNLPSSLHDSPPHADSSSPRAAPALPSPLTGKRRALIPPQVVYTDESFRPIPEEGLTMVTNDAQLLCSRVNPHSAGWISAVD
uniref:Uncharacterized protein n=1 Tax=Oryza nivara TaxID=4536 RepID=A0A0E0IC07_ORYNI